MECTGKASRLKVTDLQIVDAIQTHCGVLAYAALHLGISRTALYQRIKASPELREVRDSYRQRLFRIAEDMLVEALEASETWATKFTLQTLGRAEEFWDRDEPQFAEPPRTRQPRVKKAVAGETEDSETAACEAGSGEAAVPEILNERRGGILDHAHRNLLHGMEDAMPWAIKFCLRNFGYAHGYGYRHPRQVASDGATSPAATPMEATPSTPLERPAQIAPETTVATAAGTVTVAETVAAAPDCETAQSAKDLEVSLGAPTPVHPVSHQSAVDVGIPTPSHTLEGAPTDKGAPTDDESAPTRASAPIDEGVHGFAGAPTRSRCGVHSAVEAQIIPAHSPNRSAVAAISR